MKAIEHCSRYNDLIKYRAWQKMLDTTSGPAFHDAPSVITQAKWKIRYNGHDQIRFEPLKT